MGKLTVLDCTLRDGGYCNQWRFGKENIKTIIDGLVSSGIETIECGFLTNRITYDEEASRYRRLDEIGSLISYKEDKLFVCMINYGEYDIDEIPRCEDSTISGLRIAFHKRDMEPALEFCQKIKEKGYKLYMQPMVSLNYADEEFLNLINRSNEIEPDAFYIVDSFGVMKRKDLLRMFYMVEHNLKKSIAIGYHAHNNMQLAYANAQTLVDMRIKHDLIIDTCILGMGRGAGNLNTELFLEYLNDNTGSRYYIRPLIKVIDEVLNYFYQAHYWGYSLPNYLSAKYNTHPNYAGYFSDKNTLNAEDIDEIFLMMDDVKRVRYDKDYAEELYIKYMEVGKIQEMHLNELQDRLKGKDVLLIAPGPSSVEEKEKIIECACNEKIVSISVNFEYEEYQPDFIFVSNMRRFRNLDVSKRGKCIVTSNISASDVYLKASYHDLLNNWDMVRDNAAMMLIKYLITLGVKRVLISGLDGYSSDPMQNFADKSMAFYTQRELFEKMNIGMSNALMEFKDNIEIEFITKPRHLIFKGDI